ncbi:MAG TPA: hypothetical protein DCR93_28550 [Cytophagales bacterium]|nr:hypothetical protein [Cytophagales bacterium]HAP63285.1 hypothetical protein [Cytophagales bacterium]
MVYRFVEGRPRPWDPAELEVVLSKYGKVQKGAHSVELIPSGGKELFEAATLHGEEEGKPECLGISRPLDEPLLGELIFDLLGLPNTFFFTEEVDWVKARDAVWEDLPDEMLEGGDIDLRRVIEPSEILSF